MRHAAWVVVLLIGCTDEVTITSGTCGNDVLEPGEDCDAPGSACTPTCRLACSATQACPGGMACGHDGACHAPTGLVHEATVETFATGTSGLGDIDGDGIADAIGVDSGSVASALGAPTMPLASVLQQSAPAASGFATIRDYTGDGRPDVLLPTTGGLFAFASTTGALAPVAFPHDESPPGKAIHMRGAASLGAGTLVLLDAVGDAAGAITDTLLSIDGVAGVRPCSMVFGPGAIKGRALHPYRDGNRQLVPMVLSEAVDTANQNRLFTGLCVDGPGVGTDARHVGAAAVAAGTSTATIGETFFASLDASPCPDLVVPLTSPQGQPEGVVIPGLATGNGCTIASVSNGVTTIVGAGSPLAMIHLDTSLGPKTPALVTTLGIITVDVSSKTWSAVTPATRPWEYVVVADVNGDGREDLITVGTSNDVEVLTQLGSTTPQPQFHQTVIPTPDAIQLVATGDFDGDHQLDVAMVALDTLGSHDGHIEASFAEPPTAYTAPATLATISELYFLVARDVLDPTLPAGFDHTDDVLIGAGGDDLTSESASLTYFYGAGSRQMFAPKTGPSIAGYKGLFAFGGRFGDGGAYGVVAGFAPDVIGQAATGALVTLTTTDEANLSNPSTPIVTGGCGQLGIGIGSFCIDQAKFGVWARSTATPGDVLVGFRDDFVLPGDPTCGASFVTGETSLALDPCATMFPQPPAYTQWMGTSGNLTTTYAGQSFGAVRVLAPSDDQATLMLGGSYTLGTNKTGAVVRPTLSSYETALVGHMTLGSSGPIVDQLIELGGACPSTITNCTPTEVSAYTGTPMYCNDAALIELGSREVDGKTYGGAGKELVTACAVRSARGVTPDAAVFARFAAPDGGPPHYETLVASTGVPHMSVRAGDVNGDGLEDVVGTAGATGNGELFVFLQCDAHDTSCTKEGH
ncbi:MAG: VCBS repeat-containing protein [Deltaproteobacteria bacterium]|nr:VCBS repeat-containing protein [Deltaproteobacteria bacterium]